MKRKEFTITENDAGRRADRFLAKAVPCLPASLIQKLFRGKDIKRNGKRVKADEHISEGDVLTVYLPDGLLSERTADDSFLRAKDASLSIVYEDENLLFADKPPGLLCHPGEEGGGDTLIDRMKAYLYRKGEYRPEEENAFAPALTHRIDRNTGGIVICAKNLPALREMSEIIRERQIEKDYLCVVHGSPSPPEGELSHFLRRDLKLKKVRVYSEPVPDGRSARLLYRTLSESGGLSLLSCRLITGRTHQIRAQMAAFGHPLLGDGKYGVLGKDYRGPKYQALYAYKLSFPKTLRAERLSYLAGRSFQVAEVPFAAEFQENKEGFQRKPKNIKA